MADISLNELQGPILETPQIAPTIGALLFLFGVPETFLDAESHRQTVAFGTPTIVADSFLDAVSISQEVRFGEPFISAAVGVPSNPVVVNVSGSGRSNDPFVCTVQLAAGTDSIARQILWVRYDSLQHTEMVYDGDQFGPEFDGASKVQALAAGKTYLFTLIRNGGWPAAPRVFVHANTALGGMTVG